MAAASCQCAERCQLTRQDGGVTTSETVEPCDTDPVTVACVTGIVRAESVVANALNENWRRHGLTAAGFNVLMIVEGSPSPLCPHDIGRRRLVTKGTVTGVIDSLVKLGLVVRQPHPADRRMQLIGITDAGRALLRELLPEHRRIEERVLGRLAPAERRTLARLLARVGEDSSVPNG
jgi:DNA-binding MarR family transcriptional regulator